jgi:hypothetical protein
MGSEYGTPNRSLKQQVWTDNQCFFQDITVAPDEKNIFVEIT